MAMVQHGPSCLNAGREVTIKFFDKGVVISKIIRCHSDACKEAICGARTRHIFLQGSDPPPQKIVCMNTCITNTIFKNCFVTPPLSKGTQGQARDHRSIMTWLIFDLFLFFSPTTRRQYRRFCSYAIARFSGHCPILYKGLRL